MYKYGNPDERRGGILSRRSTKCEDGNAHASMFSIALCHPTIRWGSVCFFRYSHGFRSRCSLHTMATLCRLAIRRGSQIPLASLARLISICPSPPIRITHQSLIAGAIINCLNSTIVPNFNCSNAYGCDKNSRSLMLILPGLVRPFVFSSVVRYLYSYEKWRIAHSK